MRDEDTCEDRGLAQLNRAERLLLTMLRELVTGAGVCTGVLHELNALCGPEASDVLLKTGTFLVALDRGARRKLRVAPPGWRGPTQDERQMMAMMAAAQAGEEVLLTAQARWLVVQEHQPLLVAATRTLGEALAASGLQVLTRGLLADPPIPQGGQTSSHLRTSDNGQGSELPPATRPER